MMVIIWMDLVVIFFLFLWRKIFPIMSQSDDNKVFFFKIFVELAFPMKNTLKIYLWTDKYIYTHFLKKIFLCAHYNRKKSLIYLLYKCRNIYIFGIFSHNHRSLNLIRIFIFTRIYIPPTDIIQCIGYVKTLKNYK